MTLQEQFRDAVLAKLPAEIGGLVPTQIDAVPTAQDAVVIAVNFQRRFGADDVRQVALYVTASGRELAAHADDMDTLAQRRIETGIRVALKIDEPFFRAAA